MLRRRDTSDYGSRILDYLESGNTEMVKFLFAIGFLNKYDGLDPTGNNKHCSSDSVSPLHIVARYSCPNYMKMIDILLQFGVELNGEADGLTVTENAIIYKNLDVAAYLIRKGGKYSSEQIRINGDVSVLDGLDSEIKKLQEAI